MIGERYFFLFPSKHIYTTTSQEKKGKQQQKQQKKYRLENLQCSLSLLQLVSLFAQMTAREDEKKFYFSVTFVDGVFFLHFLAMAMTIFSQFSPFTWKPSGSRYTFGKENEKGGNGMKNLSKRFLGENVTSLQSRTYLCCCLLVWISNFPYLELQTPKMELKGKQRRSHYLNQLLSSRLKFKKGNKGGVAIRVILTWNVLSL